MFSLIAPNLRTEPLSIGTRFTIAVGICILAAGSFLACWQILRPVNWWVVFILLPAIGLTAAGGYAALRMRRWHPLATGLAGAGIVPLAAACMFLASADWSIWWPAMVAAPGVTLIVMGTSAVDSPEARAWFRTVFSAGAMLLLYAAIFLAGNLGVSAVWSPPYEIAWWGAPMLIPGLAAFCNAWQAARITRHRSRPAIRLLVSFGLSVCAVAAAILEGASGNVQISVGLMAGGLGLLF